VTPARSPREHAEESLLGLLLWQEGSESPIIDTDKVRVRYQELYVKYDLPQRELAEHEKMEHALRAEHMHEVGPLLKEAAEELLYKLEREVLKDRQAVLWKKLNEAEARGDKDEAAGYLKEYQQLTPRLIELEHVKNSLHSG
jgi:hypothetical protein